jgi:8-oxo-dGTP pyrophosphatase MutT (NUDIX family)
MRKVVSAGGIIAAGDQILLLRHHSQQGYTFVKGHVEEGESTEVAAVREMAEEAGIKAEIMQYLGTFTRPATEDTGERVEKDIVLFKMFELDATGVEPEEDIVWVAYETAVQHMFYPVEAEFLAAHRAALIGDL